MEEALSGISGGRLKLVEIPEEPSTERADEVEVPEVDPQVSEEAALRALQNAPGGPELIEELRRAGKEI